MNITDVCVRKPVFAWMLMAATLLFGGIAATRIGISQFPDVDFPTISVNATWEGANPDVIENDVVDIIEESLMQVEGVRAIRSTCRRGAASITIELDLSRNVDLALQQVQTQVAQSQRRLPKDLDPPTVHKSNPEDQPILFIAVSGPFSRQFLADFARYRLKERLQGIPGVGEVSMFGFLERNVRIWLDARKLDQMSMTVSDVISAIGSQHIELPAGQLETQGRQINVRVMGEAIDLAALRKVTIGKVAGTPVHLDDVALVEDGFEDEVRRARANGSPSQMLGVRKQRGTNAVAVATDVKRALAVLRKSAPKGLDIIVANDATRFIEESVHEIEFELLLSVVLTGLVCWLFLGSFSSTLNVLLAIPMSLFGTVAVIYFLGFTLNTFTLLGLALAVGIVVDDAIMVLENIVRHAEMGKHRVKASLEGTAEIAFAALAATVAIVAIFSPVIFIAGIIGKFFLQFGVTLSIAVLLSYVEAVTLAPARCAQFISAGHEGRNWIGRLSDWCFGLLERAYAAALARSLRWPVLVLVVAVVLCAAAFDTLSNLPREFVPTHDVGRMAIRLQTAVGSDLRETDRLVRRAERYMSSRPEITDVLAMVGGGGGGGGGSVNAANIMANTVPAEQRKKTHVEIASEVRKELNSYPGLKAIVQDLSQQGLTGQRGFPVEFYVRGPEWTELARISQDVIRSITESGTVVDVDTDYLVGMPGIRIIPDTARAADLGISIGQVATAINALVGGIRVGKFTTGGRRIDIRVRLLASQRTRPEDVSMLKVRTPAGALVPLSALVRVEDVPELQTITRRERDRAISIFANVAPGRSQEEALRAVEKLGEDLPQGYGIVLSGASVTFRESSSALVFALIVGIVVAYMVLASQFNSFLHPVTVLTILPLSVAGAAVALRITGASLNMFSMIGLLLLMGISKKNSIILVDFANQLREQGMEALPAMQRAGPTRLRPILMTSVATLMAAIPPALGLGPGAETRGPMAIGIIGGLCVSTLLSLLVVPAFYVLADRFIPRHEPDHEPVQPAAPDPVVVPGH